VSAVQHCRCNTAARNCILDATCWRHFMLLLWSSRFNGDQWQWLVFLCCWDDFSLFLYNLVHTKCFGKRFNICVSLTVATPYSACWIIVKWLSEEILWCWPWKVPSVMLIFLLTETRNWSNQRTRRTLILSAIFQGIWVSRYQTGFCCSKR